MEIQVSNWGNSLGVRIPSALVKKLGLGNGSRLEAVLEDGRIVLSPVEGVSLETLVGGLTLQSLMAQVTDENRPDAADDIDNAVGKEVW